MRGQKPWTFVVGCFLLGLGLLIGTVILTAIWAVAFLFRVFRHWVVTGSWEPLRNAWDLIS